MYIILGLVKNLYAIVFFFKEARSIDESATTAMVDSAPNDMGRYITPIINDRAKSGGTLSSNSSTDARCLNPIKIKQPAAISQNLDVIKKYAAVWFVGYK